MSTVGRRQSRWFLWLRRGLDVLFPPRCVSCSRLGTWFCRDCQASVEPIPAPICDRCGQSTGSGDLCSRCRIEPIRLEGIRSVAIHGGALQQAIHDFKYERRRELADTLGQMLYDYWRMLDLHVDLVLSVPLHPDRQKERGFNQSGLLAAVLSAHAQLPLDESHLVRTRATAPQVGLATQEREVNVQGAFEWTGDDLEGVRVLLVDDVCTTGATLEACAQPLRSRGANSIWALTLTRPSGKNSLLV